MARRAPDAPARIGPYRVVRRLGAGGMGVVYLTTHDDTGRLAAVKLIQPMIAANARMRERLRREVAAARRVPRSCTAEVLDADLVADPPWVATEYIEGPTLFERVKGSGRLHGRELEELAAGVALALREIHACDVVHRDLKPANILMSRLGPRVIDFGIARVEGADPQLTRAGEQLGTPTYMAPEQVRGDPARVPADIFAWAGVVTFAATGEPPFGSDDHTWLRIRDQAPDLRELPPPLRHLVSAAFHKHPARRPSAADLVSWLEERAKAATDQIQATAHQPVARATTHTLVDSDPAGTLRTGPAPPPPEPPPRQPAAAPVRPAPVAPETRAAPDPPPPPAAEIDDLRVTTADGVVTATWRPPPGATAVRVRRAAGRPVRGHDDGDPVTPTDTGFTDPTLPPTVRHHYLAWTVYRAPDGTETATAGMAFDALPAAPPEPVAELRLDPVPGEPAWLRATFPAPPAGSVALRALALDAPPPRYGARVPVDALPGEPAPAAPAPDGGLVLAAPDRRSFLLAVTVHGDQAAVGAGREWWPLVPPTGLACRRRGEEVLVTWHWPADVPAVELCHRPAGDTGPWTCRRVGAASYRTDGGVTLRPGPGRHEVSVASVVPTAGRELTGPLTTVTVDVPVPGRYTIDWSGRPDRWVVATITAAAPVRVSRLVLVAAQDWPVVPDAGEVLAAANDVDLGPSWQRWLPAREPARPRPYWLRCFAVGGTVELRDPPIHQLRVG